MAPNLVHPCALPDTNSWKQGWLDAFPCDMPSSVPYPRVPLYTLLEHAACSISGPTGVYSLRRTNQLRAAGRPVPAPCPCAERHGRRTGEVRRPAVAEHSGVPRRLQAVWLTGATALQLSPLMVHEEVAHWLKSTDCRIVMTLDLLAPIVTASLDEGPLEHLILCSLVKRMAMWRGMLYRIERYRRNGFLSLPDDAKRHRFDALVQCEPLTEPAAVNPAEEVAVLAPTGGTTASPKAVMLTHRNLVCNAMQLRDWCDGADGTTSVLGVLPFFHSYGLTVSLLSSWAQAATIHLHPRFEARAVLNILLEQKPEIVPAVPAILSALNNVMRGKKYDLSFIRGGPLRCGGSDLRK